MWEGDICVRVLEKVYLEHVQNLCSTVNIFGLIKLETVSWEQRVARMDARKGFSWGKKPIRRSRLKWGDNIESFLKNQWHGVDWTDLALDNFGAVWKPLLNLGVP